MLWDGFLFLVLISLLIAGWNVGIINSWRGPIAMIAATIATQQFYIDFGTWIAQQTLFDPKWSAFLSYVMMWLVIEIVAEICMNLFLPWTRKERPVLFDRLGGCTLAFVRWSVICTFPMMAMMAPTIKIPEAPKAKDGLINPLQTGFEDSNILNAFGGIGKGLLPSLGAVVVSDKAPSFKPNFDRPKVELN